MAPAQPLAASTATAPLVRLAQLEEAVALLARQLLLAIEHPGRWPAQEDRVALARLATDHPSAWGR